MKYHVELEFLLERFFAEIRSYQQKMEGNSCAIPNQAFN